MVKTRNGKKNERIMNLVSTLVWQVAIMAILLGIVFPVIFFLTLKVVYLREQHSMANTARTFVSDMIDTKKKVISFASLSSSFREEGFAARATPELRGVPEDAAPRARKLLSDLLDTFPAFRFFAYLSVPDVRPLFLEPYSLQGILTEGQYLQGYDYREWAKKTKELFDAWDGIGRPPVYVSNAFLAQPGDVPGVSLSVVVDGSRQAAGLSADSVSPKTNVAGILYGNIALEELSAFMRTLSFGKTGIVYLVDAEGNLLAHPYVPTGVAVTTERGERAWTLRSMAESPVIERALRGDLCEGIVRRHGSRNLVLATCEIVPETGWFVVVEQDTRELFSTIRLYALVVIAIILATVLVTAVIFAYIARETAETAREHDELRVISETDPLTGLLNRRSMLSRMRNFLSDYAENKQGFVIGLFDIDDFKVVNDTYGHVFGDVVLREIAARSVSILRVDDLLFRWGGEEFLVVVRNCDLVRGRGIAEKIRRVVSDSPISDSSVSIRVTVTIGLCEYRGGSIDSLIIQADEALYEGKRTGKNRVVVGGP